MVEEVTTYKFDPCSGGSKQKQVVFKSHGIVLGLLEVENRKKLWLGKNSIGTFVNNVEWQKHLPTMEEVSDHHSDFYVWETNAFKKVNIFVSAAPEKWEEKIKS